MLHFKSRLMFSQASIVLLLYSFFSFWHAMGLGPEIKEERQHHPVDHNHHHQASFFISKDAALRQTDVVRSTVYQTPILAIQATKQSLLKEGRPFTRVNLSLIYIFLFNSSQFIQSRIHLQPPHQEISQRLLSHRNPENLCTYTLVFMSRTRFGRKNSWASRKR